MQKHPLIVVEQNQKSNPRTYKAVRKGMEFDGEIEFYHFDEEICQKCKKYLIQNLEKFNDGIYRLGGSKSRGYGKFMYRF